MMIKPKELRIGNTLQIEQSGHIEYVTVYGLHPEDFYVNIECRDIANGCYDNKHNDLQQVPLTPEILEKCGFEKDVFMGYQILIDNKEMSTVSKKLYFSGDYLYLEEWRDGVKTYERDLITLWNKDVMKTFYLHQLQNLIYSLTGEELEVKL